MKKLIPTCLMLLFVPLCLAQDSDDRITVLIVDGFSNHDWKQTTAASRQILEMTGMFKVSVSTCPSTPEDPGWKTWDPGFSAYDVVIQNCNNIKNKELRWPGKIESELEDYVREGGGLYILHSGNNSFSEWDEYNQMIGMGWRKKDAGDALEIADDGKVIRIPSGEGKNTSHGARFEALIQVLTPHAINQGFPEKWRTPNMELYLYPRGPAKNVTILSYAKDPVGQKGWPVEWLIKYGAGNVYNSSLGHLWKGETFPESYRCIGFQTTMIRTLEWLATGKVTYPVPANFPDENSISLQAEHEIIQGDDHWIVLEANRAEHTDVGLSWDFIVNRAGKYDVQLIFDGDLESALPEIEIQTGDMLINEIPEKIFTIGMKGSEQTVFQYSKGITFEETGPNSMTIQPETSIQAVRIIPDYRKRIGFGTDKFLEEWLAMHHSPEKQASLEWLEKAKYGMFIHWGLYSQAGGIWKEVRMEDSGIPGPGVSEWLMFKFQIPRHEYEKLAEGFNPDRSFAQNIAKLAKDAGMKYVVITSKHHDGFALFDSECSDYDITDRTPYKADAIMELYHACLDQGLEFGVYYSHGNDWYDGSDGNYAAVKKHNDSLGILSTAAGKNTWDPSPNTHAEYLEKKAYPQVEELVKMMPELRLIWFDGDGYITEEQAFRFYKLVYDLNPSVLVNRRVGYDFGDYLDAGDNVIPSASQKMKKYWETCGTTNNSWAFKSYDDDWKSAREMLYYLVDIASKGGNYLLNIGPDGKGHVPESSADGLLEMGKWLKVNGEAIYGTKAWIIPHEGQNETLLEGTGHRAQKGFSRSFTTGDFWFTSKNNKVYAISLLPAEDTVRIKALKKETGTIQNARLLGTGDTIEWVQTETELQLDFRGLATGENGFAVELTLLRNE